LSMEETGEPVSTGSFYRIEALSCSSLGSQSAGASTCASSRSSSRRAIPSSTSPARTKPRPAAPRKRPPSTAPAPHPRGAPEADETEPPPPAFYRRRTTSAIPERVLLGVGRLGRLGCGERLPWWVEAGLPPSAAAAELEGLLPLQQAPPPSPRRLGVWLVLPSYERGGRGNGRAARLPKGNDGLRPSPTYATSPLLRTIVLR
jgi:hypothetical protein